MESPPRLHPHLSYLKRAQHCASIELDPFRPLAALSDLECLNIALHFWQPSNLPIVFPVLRSLMVSCHDLATNGVLLAHVDALRPLSFSASEEHRNSRQLSQELPNHLRTLIAKYPSLTEFEWSSRQPTMPKMGYLGQQRTDAPLAELIGPLLAMRAMRRFIRTSGICLHCLVLLSGALLLEG